MAGDVGFDPLGLSEIDEVGIDLYWMREAELKHGRVAMLAVAGILQVEIFGPAPGCGQRGSWSSPGRSDGVRPKPAAIIGEPSFSIT